MKTLTKLALTIVTVVIIGTFTSCTEDKSVELKDKIEKDIINGENSAKGEVDPKDVKPPING